METENVTQLRSLIEKLQKCTVPSGISNDDLLLACKFLQEALKLIEQKYQ